MAIPRDLRTALTALSWGFSEGTLFFIIPDVLISWVAMRSLRRSLWVALIATCGAALGGLVMAQWAHRDADQALGVVESVPAISQSMIEGVEVALEEKGFPAMVEGAFRGRPYKVYAAVAGTQEKPWWQLLLWTVPARLSRFLPVALVAALLVRGPLRRWTPKRRKILLGSFWAVFYILFLTLMPN